MSFSPDWLALRASFDAAARSPDLEARLAGWAVARSTATARPLAVVDLGAGSGNNRRHMAPRLPVLQAWTLVDADPVLLEVAQRNAPDAVLLQADLVTDLESAIPAGTDLVTASALIDLVSESWLRRLMQRVNSVGAALFVVLTYDGRMTWTPQDARDDLIRDLVNRHQRTDKGFGPALGPDAGTVLARLAGGRLLQAPSDWTVGPRDIAMRHALADGWAEAASAVEPHATPAIEAWRRSARERTARIVVGHLDQLVTPPA